MVALTVEAVYRLDGKQLDEPVLDKRVRSLCTLLGGAALHLNCWLFVPLWLPVTMQITHYLSDQLCLLTSFYAPLQCSKLGQTPLWI
ncbi:hypothetical protein LSTR_LSTR008106 [Laodelphax striatellus]|uniref:Uncharacterized protein n=1 Tax=Laodelphax striatellus TaxID=195883 RepID=A0A482WUC8_LAOST|nr:hypothetical protein LSTR_LSTR016241 [Laodelphax striatellus]RZF43593.1 hypothetical protein LSTR_LSTR008106 [Laodelphax striatellus]